MRRRRRLAVIIVGTTHRDDLTQPSLKLIERDYAHASAVAKAVAERDPEMSLH